MGIRDREKSSAAASKREKKLDGHGLVTNFQCPFFSSDDDDAHFIIPRKKANIFL